MNITKIKQTISKQQNAVLFTAVLLAVGTAHASPFTFNTFSSKPEQTIAVKEILLPTETNPNFLRQVNACLIPVSALYGYTLRISSEFRSIEKQESLYAQGRTEYGHIVTNAPPGRSLHNYGYAIDVVDRWRGFNTNWERLGKIGAYCKLEQGDEGDQAHFENRSGLTTDQLIAGQRPPDLSLPCEIMEQRFKENKKLTIEDLQSCGAPKF